jgi:hypothetical protein
MCPLDPRFALNDKTLLLQTNCFIVPFIIALHGKAMALRCFEWEWYHQTCHSSLRSGNDKALLLQTNCSPIVIIVYFSILPIQFSDEPIIFPKLLATRQEKYEFSLEPFSSPVRPAIGRQTQRKVAVANFYPH